MPSWELQLVHQITIERGDALIRVRDLGVRTGTFRTAEGIESFKFILSYSENTKHWGEIPSPELLQDEFPTTEFPQPRQSLEALCEKVVKDNMGVSFNRLLEKAIDLNEDDPRAAVNLMADELAELVEDTTSISDLDFSDGAEEVLRRYESSKKNKGVIGLPFPHPQFTKIVGGIEPGDLICLFGKPKSMKTWVLLLMGAAIFEECYGRVLVISGEMSVVRMLSRMAIILTQLDYKSYRRGKLSAEDVECLTRYIRAIQEENADPKCRRYIKIIRGLDATDSFLSGLRHKIEMYQPDIVLLDSAYLLTTDLDWKILSKFTQGLKKLAASTGVPIVAVTQENEKASYFYKGGRGTETIAHSGSWVQDADKIIKLVRKKCQDSGRWLLSMISVADREEESSAGVRITCIPATDFDFVDHKVDRTDIEDPKKNDDGEKKGGGQGGGRPQVRRLVDQVDQDEDTPKEDE